MKRGTLALSPRTRRSSLTQTARTPSLTERPGQTFASSSSLVTSRLGRCARECRTESARWRRGITSLPRTSRPSTMSSAKGEKRIGAVGGSGGSGGLLVLDDLTSRPPGECPEIQPRGPVCTPNPRGRTRAALWSSNEDRRIIEGLRVAVRIPSGSGSRPWIMTKESPSFDVETGRTACGEPVTAPSRSDGGRATGSGQKIVLLRGRGGAGPVAQPSSTEVLRLDLQGPIDALRSIRGDLELYYWERPGHGEQQERERYQVSLWIRQVTERTAALESILLHMGTSALV